jgi:hypothetical protein
MPRIRNPLPRLARAPAECLLPSEEPTGTGMTSPPSRTQEAIQPAADVKRCRGAVRYSTSTELIDLAHGLSMPWWRGAFESHTRY